MISVKNISKNFGDFAALKNVSLEIEQGSLTAILGPSGSGKSTLLRTIAGLEEPDSGSVFVDGEDISHVAVNERNIGFVFQHYAPFKHMTVYNNVAFALKIRKQKKAVIKERVNELLDLVQLSGFAHRYPSELSGGQRQRMALARALAAEPRVLLLDEPFGALDARVRDELRIWLSRLHEQTQVTTVFVTHDQIEAMELAHTIAVMDHGTIEQVGSPRDVYEKPANEFVMSFVGPITQFGEQAVRPHDFELLADQREGSTEAQIQKIVYLGFEVRVEVILESQEHIWVQLPRHEIDALELHEGQIIYVRYRNAHTFAK